MIYSDILDTIGNTPSIKIKNISVNGTNLYVKAEYFNPASSVKDRLALSIINNAEKKGVLKKGQTIVEATSGHREEIPRTASALRRILVDDKQPPADAV